MQKMFLTAITGLLLIINSSINASEIITEEWSETTAVVTLQGKTDGKFNYSLVYEIPNSTAIDPTGKKMIGPIIHQLSNIQEPVSPQNLRLKYLKNSPNIYELIEPVSYKG